MARPRFGGETYDPALDQARLDRQLDGVLAFMRDGVWRTLATIGRVSGYPEASVSARLRDLRKAKFGGYRVERRRHPEGGGTWEYRVLLPLPIGQLELATSDGRSF